MIKFIKNLPLKFKIILLIIIMAFGWFARNIFNDQKQAEPQYQTAVVERGSLISYVAASGSISAGSRINITAAATGVVDRVYVKNGDKVVSGQKIAKISLDAEAELKKTTAWLAYLTAKNNLATAEQGRSSLELNIEEDKTSLLTAQASAKNYDQYDPTDINKQKSDNARRAAEIALEIDRQKLAAYETTISKSRTEQYKAWLDYQSATGEITAPLAGVISNLTVVAGSIISSQSGAQKIGTITLSKARIQAVVNISEIDANKIKPDQKASITVDAFSEKTYTGTVGFIDNDGKTSSGVVNFPATLIFDTEETNIYPNMGVNAKIITNFKDNVLLAPSTAVQSDNGQATVRVLRDGQAVSLPVEIGLSNDTQTEIISGLSEGETIITGVTGNGNSPSTTGGASSPFSSFGGRNFSGGGGGTNVRIMGR